jgi:hypothetical protein
MNIVAVRIGGFRRITVYSGLRSKSSRIGISAAGPTTRSPSTPSGSTVKQTPSRPQNAAPESTGFFVGVEKEIQAPVGYLISSISSWEVV